MDHPRRDDDEADLKRSLMQIFRDWLRAMLDGSRVAWEEFRDRIRAALQKKLEEVALFAYLLWLGSQDLRADATTPLTGKWSPQQAYLITQATMTGSTTGRAFGDALSRAAAKFTSWAANIASSLAATLVQNIRRKYDSLRAGLETGPKMTAEIESLVTPARAESIAITETTRAFEAGKEAAVSAFETKHGVTVERIWRTKKDERVCPICYPLNLQPSAIWKVVFPDGPPAHPFCRCWIELKLP